MFFTGIKNKFKGNYLMINDINKLQKIKSIQKMNVEIKLQQLNSQQLELNQQIDNMEEMHTLLVKEKTKHIKNFYLKLKISQFRADQFHSLEYSLKVYEKKEKNLQEEIRQRYTDLHELQEKISKVKAVIRTLSVQQEKYNFILDAIK